jgi:hypothetical protein
MEVAGLAVWAEALPETKLTDEQVPLPLWTPASALPLEQGTIGPNHRHHRPNQVSFCHTSISGTGVDNEPLKHKTLII